MESNEIQALKAQLEALQSRISELEAGDEPVRANRRNMLKLAAGAAAGAAVGAVGFGASSASAAAAATNGQPITIGESNSNAVGQLTPTVIVHADTTNGPGVSGFLGSTNNTNILTVRDAYTSLIPSVSTNFSAFPAAVGGYARSTVPHGVYGFSSNSGFGVVGYGSGTDGVGMLMRGVKANAELRSEGKSPLARTDAHTKGELICDENGDTWICVAAGTPGTWRKISGTAAAGSFHAITPIRVYDSRQAGYTDKGALAPSASREISVADARDGSGNVVTANAVPEGATAVAFNITVAGPTAGNYLSITPGGVGTTPNTSIINFVANQNVANASVVAISADRKVKVWCGGEAGSTDFILDVSGYYL